MTYTKLVKTVLLHLLFAIGIACALIVPSNANSAAAPAFAFFEDHDDRLDLNQVMQQKFTPIAKQDLKFGLSKSTFWVRVDTTALQTQSLLMRSCYAPIDSLSVYVQQNGVWNAVHTGSQAAFSTREIRHPCYVFDLANSDTSQVFVKAKSGGPINVPLDLFEAEAFWIQEQDTQIMRGIYVAFLGALFAYNLLLFFIVRESAYFYYCGYLLGINLFLGTMNGVTKMYVWPESTWWADHAAVICISFGIASAMKFTSQLARAEKYAPRINQAVNIVAPAFVLVIGAQLWSGTAGIIVLGIFVAIALSLITVAIFSGSSRGYPPARILMLTIVLMAPSAIFYYAHVIGAIEESWWTQNVLYLSSALEALVLSFALAYRIKLLNQELEQQHKEVTTAQSNFSRALLKTADSERRAIARELHDSLGQALLVSKHLIRRIENNEDKRRASDHVQNLITDTRNMARNMHPQQIEILGFATALQTMLAETLTPAGIKLKFDVTDLPILLNDEAQLHLYRIAQEFATNIFRHAKASEVLCSLHFDGEPETRFLRLRIQDNGVGILPHSATGLGILNMTERAGMINARITLCNSPGGGCTLLVEVPLK